jgi:hypothetical protein
MFTLSSKKSGSRTGAKYTGDYFEVKYSMGLGMEMSLFTIMASQSLYNVLRHQKIRPILILLIGV